MMSNFVRIVEKSFAKMTTVRLCTAALVQMISFVLVPAVVVLFVLRVARNIVDNIMTPKQESKHKVLRPLMIQFVARWNSILKKMHIVVAAIPRIVQNVGK